MENKQSLESSDAGTDRKMNTNQLYAMLGKRDVEIEYLISQNKEMLQQIQELKQKNQELFDENIKLGGSAHHGTYSK